MKKSLIILLLIFSVLFTLQAETYRKSLVEKIELYRMDDKLIWEVKGYSPLGFKVLWSLNPQPEYPTKSGENAYYISDPYNLEFPLSEIIGSGNYYIRIGEYLDGTIGVYSNQIQVVIEEHNASSYNKFSVDSIELENIANLVKWEISGFSEFGFKIVWSKTAEPVYPARDSDEYVYTDNPYDNMLEIYPFDGNGWYFVRVMEYRDGKPGVYSNEIKVYLED